MYYLALKRNIFVIDVDGDAGYSIVVSQNKYLHLGKKYERARENMGKCVSFSFLYQCSQEFDMKFMQ